MPDSGLGAVIVGTGFGVLTHLRALQGAGIEVRALVGRNPEKTLDRARKVGVEHGLTSLGDALALPGVDIVSIATPPHTHCEIALEAIAAGKHLLCEKPFARNAEEAQRMLDAAEAAGIVHLLGTEFRFSTGQALATRAIHGGAIGEPRLVNFTLNAPILADPSGEVPAWWSTAEEGGGWLGAYASHIIDQLRHTLGEFAGVSASLSLVSDRDWSAEDSYTVHFRLKSGVDGVLQSTAGGWGMPVMCSKFYGNQGTLSIEGDNVTLADADGIKTLDVPEDLVNPAAEPPPAEFMVTTYDHLHAGGFDLGPYTKLCALLRDRVLGKDTLNDPAPATFADGVAGQKVLDAIRLSSAERRWVDIE
ncbi:MAG: Gfo/Idh/MocA family oxidoreductase [Deltaproteobacteria bacterium]|nr:Gfo/Idh/MocA family oxidoreductase [Deltaproteobacteria bacterium]